jgi:hypothetical protein
MERLGQAIGCLVTIAVAGVIGVFLLGSYVTLDWFNGDIIESPKRIIPEIKLTTDGKKVDTLFIYKVK